MTGGTVATSYGVTLTWTLEEDRVGHTKGVLPGIKSALRAAGWEVVS